MVGLLVQNTLPYHALLCTDRCVAFRLDYFVVGLTNTDPSTAAPVFKNSYTVCAQHGSTVGPYENVTVTCSPSSFKFRFVIVQSSRTANAMCLVEVAVYARSELAV